MLVLVGTQYEAGLDPGPVAERECDDSGVAPS
jgi:hypothetical protein